jgi:acyl transferase domain-containing protein/thioesterase domain-containing protein/acyl carrier protein
MTAERPLAADDDQVPEDEAPLSTDIAVVGMSGRFPGARDLQAYWQNLVDGKESIRRLSDEELLAEGVDAATLRDPRYVKAAAVFDDVEGFDAPFFGFSPREASILDPQHRHFLEVCWESLEHAGHTPEGFKGRIGVFGGSGMNAYMPYNLFTNKALMRDVGLFLIRHTGNDKDFLTTRVSYCLDLRGPVVNVQTACSTSLVAIHLATQSLLAGECDMALAGGVTIELPHRHGYFYEEGEILSPDGHCRAFDHRSQGTVFGSAVGVVVLRRLSDAVRDGDTIHAVVKATAINNDGARKVGYLAPSVDGQAECIVEAINLAGLSARDVSYVECHGTGTAVGDPIEVTALTQAFRASTPDTGFCRIGSVKTNIGHTDTAAGIASFMKVALMLQHETIAPTLNYEKANPAIEFAKTPFLVADAKMPWPRKTDAPRRAGVSSLGVGGTNAHVIVEEAPVSAPRQARAKPHLLALSARTEKALDEASVRLASHLERHPHLTLDDVSHTLLAGRRRFAHRRVLAAETAADAIAMLRGTHERRALTHVDDAKERPVVFMLPGGGAQHPGMFREVYDHERVFKDVVDECLATLRAKENLDIRRWLFPEPGDDVTRAAHMLEGTAIGLPALATVMLAMDALLRSFGISPVATIGHSLGENVAAHLAGVIDRETLLSIVACRGRLFEELEEGAMLSISLGEDEARTRAQAFGLDVATVNADALVVVSGRPAAIDGLAAELEKSEIEHRRLRIRTAAHSAMLDGILPKFQAHVASKRLAKPVGEYISNVTGTWMRAEDAADPAYWARHLRSPVRFRDGLASVLERFKDAVLVEIGPGTALSSFARQNRARKPHQVAIPTARHPNEPGSDRGALALALGRMWASAVPIAWDRVRNDDGVRRVPLPTYPFQHERHWIAPGQGFFRDRDVDDDALTGERDLARWFYTPTFVEEPASLAADPRGEVWLVLDDPADKSAGTADAVDEVLRARGVTVVRVHAGAACVVEPTHATVRPGEPDDIDDVVQATLARHQRLDRVVDLWGVTGVTTGAASDRQQTTKSFDAPFALMRVLGNEGRAVRVLVVTDGLLSVHGEPVRHPTKALALGPVKVAPKELPEISATLLDVPLAGAAALDDVARAIVDEACATVAEPVVAWRGGRRHVERFTRHPVSPPEARFALDGEGAILITGGLGGLGLTFARALADAGTRALVLVGRTALPPRETWEDAIAARPPRDPLRQRIEAVLAIEAKGTRVLTVAADVSSLDDMRRAFADADRAGAPVRAVLHAAGVVDDAPIGMKSLESARAVIAPKVDGARVLAELTRERTLDALVFFSSTSAALGPPGQVDYVAANAYLDALAVSLAPMRAETRVVAVAWGVWKDVGMAASMFDVRPHSARGENTGHPLLGHREKNGAHTVFTNVLAPDRTFVLDHHRLRTANLPVLPGTAYVELVRAAATLVDDGKAAFAPLEITDLYFTTPLAVPDGTSRFLEVDTSTDENGQLTVRVESSPAQGGSPVEHARAHVTRLVTDAPRIDVKALAARCRERVVTFEPGAQSLPQDQQLAFGPSWKAITSMRFDVHEGTATLSRPAGDTSALALHPGVLDMLSGFAFSLLDPGAPGEGVVVPLGYEKVRVFAPLAERVVSHVVVKRPLDASGVGALDVTVADESGRVLLVVEGYLVKRVPADAIALSAPRDDAPQSSEPSRVARWLEHGIAPAEGEEALFRVLQARGLPRVVVSSLDLYRLAEELAPKRVVKKAAADTVAGGPSASADAPRDDVERTLADLWKSLLGVEDVGIRDNFFDLGGHSLIAVRLFARIKKLYGVDLSISVLFEAPTIETCAAILRRELGIELDLSSAPDKVATVEAAPVTTSTDDRRFNPLVVIAKGDGGVPFFCVHGAGGNVLNFRDLSRHLGSTQPFYALQAQGVDGRQPPAATIEAMADLYLPEIERVWPQGPYVLGGYSGGGVVAVEMAKRLVRAGRRVSRVVLFDTFSPGVVAKRPTFRARLEKIVEEGPAYFPRRAQALVTRHTLRLSKELKVRFFESQGVPLPLELRDHALTYSFYEAVERYHPERYDGEVTLFRAREVAEVFAHVGTRLGWDGTLPKLHVEEIPGDHDSLVLEPNVQVLTAHLRDLLSQARNGGSSS